WDSTQSLDSRGAPNRKLQQHRFAATVVGAGALVVCSRSLNARAYCCIPRSSRLLIASRYQSSHIEERYLLYNRAHIHPAEPTVMNDVIVSSPMLTENQRTSRPEFAWLAGFNLS